MFIPGALPKLERTLPIQPRTVKEESLELWRKTLADGTGADSATGFPYREGGAIPQCSAGIPASGFWEHPAPSFGNEAGMLRESAGRDACATSRTSSQPFLNFFL